MEHIAYNNAFKQKDLLLITHDYYSFTKDQIETIAPYFRNVTVLVRYKPIAEIANLLPIDDLKRHRKSRLIDLRNTPANINVIAVPLFYLPTDAGYKKLGEKHFKAVKKIIAQHNIKFDLIHAHFTWSAGYVGARLKKEHRVPFVITAHRYDIIDLPFRDDEWKGKIEYVLNTADCIITVSHKNLEYLDSLDVKTPIKVIPNGFRVNLFYPRNPIECRTALNIPLDKKIILVVGYLVEQKGHKYLIKAMGKIVEQRKDILCVIVGSGKLKNNIEKQIKALNLTHYVQLTGGKPHDEIPVWMNASDALVLPSLSEGNPTVMFECLGCGKPFIGTKVGGIPEIIVSEDYGFLLEPENAQVLAKKILAALDKEFDKAKILQYAQQFTWEQVINQITDTYVYLWGIDGEE